jgi:hypothetical protein
MNDITIYQEQYIETEWWHDNYRKKEKDAYGTNDRQTKYPPRIAFQSHIESDIPFSIHIAIKSPVVFPHLEIRHLQSHVFKRKLEPGKRADVFVQ